MNKSAKRAMEKYVEDCVRMGYSLKAIRECLVRYGYGTHADLLIKNYRIKKTILLLLPLFAALIVFGFFSYHSSITGLVVAGEQVNYSDSVNLKSSKNSEYIWIPQNSGHLAGLSISGSYNAKGNVRVYLEDGSEKYLIFDSIITNPGKSPGITGLAVSDVAEILNDTFDVDNESMGNSLGKINDSDNLSSILNDSVKNHITANESEDKIINIKLKYGDHEFYDADNDGIEGLNGVVDLTVKDTEFGWQADESNLCTMWNVESIDDGLSTVFCNGNANCCAFVGLKPTNSDWDRELFLTYGLLGASFENDVSAQVIYFDYNLSETIPYLEIYNSSWEKLNAEFRDSYSYFENKCFETCALSLNETSYKFIIETANSELNLEKINYIIQGQEESAEEQREEQTNRGRVVINSPVRWVKKVKLNDAKSDVSVNITQGAVNITVKKIDESVAREIPDEKIKVRYGNMVKDLEEYKSENDLNGGIPGKIPNLLTGNAILEGGSIEESITTEIIIEEQIEEVEIEFFTEGPTSEETVFDSNKKRIVVSSDIHYEDILAYTYLPVEANPGKSKLFWIVNGSRINVNTDEYDTDENGLIDYIEWVVPSLSSQTYELIIEITKAEHLDENREFVADVYDLVKERDQIWTSEIAAGNYIRVKFEQSLASNNDITIYARSNYPDSTVEVYEKDKNNLLAAFEGITEEKKHQIFLTNLAGKQDTFDLRIINYPIEFDYIVDPLANSSNPINLSEWPMDGRTLNGTRYYPGVIPDDISQLDIRTYSIGATAGDPTIAGGFLYGMGLRTAIFKLNLTNITHRIDIGTDHDLFQWAVPPVWNDFVYAGAENGRIYQYNNSNLTHVIAFNSNSNAQHYSSPIVYEGFVYFSDWHGTSGNKVFQANASNVTHVINSYSVNGCEGAPVIDNGYIYYGCGSSKIYQLNATNISAKIAEFTAGAFDSGHGIAVANGYLYFGTQNNIVYQLNSSNISKIIANYTTAGDVEAAPAVGNGFIYVGSFDGYTYQLNGSNISQQIANYSTGAVSEGLTVTDRYLLVGGGGALIQLNAMDISQFVANYTLSTPGTPTIANGIIYMASGSNFYQFGSDKPQSILKAPANAYSITSSNRNVTFNCSAFDTNSLANVSLYLTNSQNTSFSLNQTVNVSGQSNSTNWTLELATDGNYTWNCLTYDNEGFLDWSTNRSIAVDDSLPVVTLNKPSDGYYNDTAEPYSTKFNCSATDNVALANISLYITDGSNASFSLNRTTVLSGRSALSNWTLNLANGNYTWNCLAYDTAGSIDWGNSNRSILINYTDLFLPRVNATLNISRTRVGTSGVVNLSANVSDDNQLSFGQIIVNDTGFNRIFNFSLSGTSAKFSQNITLSASLGTVINFTARANDSRNNFATNDTIITVVDIILPVINGTLNKSLTGIENRDVINLTANATDETGLSFGQIIVNISGFKRIFNFSLGGATSATFSQNITINVSAGSAINFTVRVNDTANNFRDNITTITVMDLTSPIVNSTLNVSRTSIGATDTVNISANVSDDTQLSIGQIIVNDTGFIRFFNFSLSGTSRQFSQNITLSASLGTVINFTARANDSRNNFAMNDTIITIGDRTLPTVNASLNKTFNNITRNSVVNLTANSTDETGLSFGQIIVNISGFIRIFNFSLSGTASAFSQNVTLNVTRGNVINFTARVNDTSNNIRTNDTIITIANTPPSGLSLLFPTSNLYANLGSLDVNITFTADYDGDSINISYYVNGTLNQTSLTNTTINASDGYYTLNVSISDSFDHHANATVNFTIDTILPNVTLLLPFNNTGDRDGNITFIFNITDTNELANCSLYSNSVQNKSITSVSRGIAQNFTMENISSGGYNWSISCTDQAGNAGVSAVRSVAVVPHIKFNGTTIDIDAVDVRNITNLTIENSVAGKINFTGVIDLSSGADINRYLNISSNRIEINSTALSALNTTAILYLYNLGFTNPKILKDGVECPSDTCTQLTYSGGTLVFNVTHFTAYSAEETTSSSDSSSSSSGSSGGGSGTSSGGGGGFALDGIRNGSKIIDLKYGDTLSIFVNGGKYSAIITNIEADSIAMRIIPEISETSLNLDLHIKAGEVRELNLDGSGLNDLRIELHKLFATGGSFTFTIIEGIANEKIVIPGELKKDGIRAAEVEQTLEFKKQPGIMEQPANNTKYFSRKALWVFAGMALLISVIGVAIHIRNVYKAENLEMRFYEIAKKANNFLTANMMNKTAKAYHNMLLIYMRLAYSDLTDARKAGMYSEINRIYNLFQDKANVYK